MAEQTFFNLASSIIAIAACVIAYQAHRHQSKRDDKTDWDADIQRVAGDVATLKASVTEALGRIAKLEGGSEMSWRILEIYAGKTLHRHEDELHIDYYLDHYDSLTAEEAQEFVNRLHEIADDSAIADGTKMAAAVKLTAVIRRYGERYNLSVPVTL